MPEARFVGFEIDSKFGQEAQDKLQEAILMIMKYVPQPTVTVRFVFGHDSESEDPLFASMDYEKDFSSDVVISFTANDKIALVPVKSVLSGILMGFGIHLLYRTSVWLKHVETNPTLFEGNEFLNNIVEQKIEGIAPFLSSGMELAAEQISRDSLSSASMSKSICELCGETYDLCIGADRDLSGVECPSCGEERLRKI